MPTVAGMTITVLDTYRQTHDILGAPAADRPELLRRMAEPAAGLYRYFPGEPDLVAMHRMTGGFPLDRDEGRCLGALAAMHGADVWGRVGRALEGGLGVLQEAVPGFAIPDITAYILLGDPANRYFMDHALGMTGNGSVTGYLALTFWPFEEVLARVEATAVHELHHNVRFAPGGAAWDPATVTVGDHVVSEGLADAFARQLYGDELGHTRIGVPHLADDEVFAKVVSGLGVTGMENFGAWVLGDEAATAFGGTPVGLPTGAGYAVGNRLVDRYLAVTGRTAAQAVHDPAREIIETALA